MVYVSTSSPSALEILTPVSKSASVSVPFTNPVIAIGKCWICCFHTLWFDHSAVNCSPVVLIVIPVPTLALAKVKTGLPPKSLHHLLIPLHLK
jgi:hypothetical protein